MTTAAKFIDSLLDNWNTATTLSTMELAVSPPGSVPTLADIKTKLKKLFLVFHMPQYPDITKVDVTKFDNGKTTPDIKATDRIFNYIYAEAYENNSAKSIQKVLLSNNGITKDNMIKLKMLLDSLVAAADEAAAYKLLTEPVTFPAIDNASLTLGGNNSILKNTGGKNNKSNKRIKKQPRRRNKSSKSLK